MKTVKAFFRFLISKLFLINLALALLVVFLIPYFTLNHLHNYTHHDVKIAVPNFIGVHVDDIDEFIEGKDLRYVISDSVYSDDFPKGTVIRQTPLPHIDSIESYVKPNRRIYLTIVKKVGEYKEVPDILTNYHSKKMAKVKLEMRGFQPMFEAKPHKSEYVLQMQYNGKDLKPGTKLLKGSIIKVIHGNGGGGKPVILPSLVGKTVAEANQAIALAGLSVEVIYENATNAQDSLNFVVHKQAPHPNHVQGGIVQSGSIVSIFAKKATSEDNHESSN